MANDKFERIEKKFWMSAEQYQNLYPILMEHMNIDEYGLSKIRNIYCDTPDYYLTRRSIEKPKFKEKLRIRSYTEMKADTKVFVEIKRKVDGIGYKRRVSIPFAEALNLLQGQTIHSKNPQIDMELEEFVKRYHPEAKVYLTYERIALYGKEDPSIRITLDQKIRYALYTPDLDLSQEGKPVLEDESRALMEVKVQGALPQWLIHAISSLKIYQVSFSKIGTCFTKHIAKNL